MLFFAHPLTFSFLLDFFKLVKRKRKTGRKKAASSDINLSEFAQLPAEPQTPQRDIFSSSPFSCICSESAQDTEVHFDVQLAAFPFKRLAPIFFSFSGCSDTVTFARLPRKKRKKKKRWKKIARLFVNQEQFVNDGGVDVEFGSSHWPD